METEEHVAARTELPPSRLSAAPPMPIAIAEPARQPFWRALTHQVDTVIKANCTTQVIPSAHAIADKKKRATDGIAELRMALMETALEKLSRRIYGHYLVHLLNA